MFLTWASFHQWPFRALSIIGVCASNKKLCLIEFDHLIVERVRPFAFVWTSMWSSRAAVAISAGQEDEIQWINFEGLVVSQANISHRREGNSNATAYIVHELLKLMPMSRIGAEISTVDDFQGSALHSLERC
jgi:hypothetical protein